MHVTGRCMWVQHARSGASLVCQIWALANEGVEVVLQVGSFRPQVIPPTEWSTTWHQLPCRLRVYAAQIEEEWQRAMPLEYGTWPAELQALQEMAGQWRQDIQLTWMPAGGQQRGGGKHRDTGARRDRGSSKVPGGHMAAQGGP